MGDRGPPPVPDAAKVIRGTFRRDRAHPAQVAELPGDPVRPRFLKGRARQLWDQRVADCRFRGIALRGAERALAHLCALDATLERCWSRGEVPTAALVNSFNRLACQFYEPPASQQGKAGGEPTPARETNPFLQHGRRPGTGGA